VARRATLVFAALAAADTLLAATGYDRPRWMTKPLLMPVLMAGRDRPAQRALALAAPHLFTFGTVNVYLWKRTGQDRIPVIVYSTTLLAMSLAALDSGSPRTAAGRALFLASDTLLALEKFGGLHLPAHEGLVMATYTSAQALLAG
jgi:hypothetical protein